jgi:hypothetical protein
MKPKRPHSTPKPKATRPPAPSPASSRVAIAVPDAPEHAADAPSLSAAQKKFNTLIKKIETQRALLQAWQAAVPDFRQKHASELEPLVEEYRRARAGLVELLDQRCMKPGLSKPQRATLSELIATMAEPLTDLEGALGESMKAAFNRHSAVDFDTLQAEEKASMQAMVRESLGLDEDAEVDLDSPESLMQHLAAKLEREEQAQADAEQARDQARQQRRGQRAQRQSERQAPKQTRAQQDAAEAGKSVREVFRRLASLLHPDREPDEAERQRKTALMQRANQAYEANDLLSLLELQLEIEQIDQHALNAIAEDRLRHYNQVLGEQLSELQQEVSAVEGHFRMEFGIDPFARLAPARLNSLLQGDKQAITMDLQDLRGDLRRLADDAYLKRWIKQQRQALRNEADFEALLGGLFADEDLF